MQFSVVSTNSLLSDLSYTGLAPTVNLLKRSYCAQTLHNLVVMRRVPDSWCGCTNGAEMRPRAKEWDEDYGEPIGVCKETRPGEGIYEREWTKAKVGWDCTTGHGKITAK